MSEIDVQNSRQIRDPMDVLITMTLADDDVNMTYSGYSTAKVADGKLNEPTWSMRKLADLQGDGFPLDGTCALYNPSTTPSQTNGKLGVRSNVGESVSVTATGNKIIASLTVMVTGAESVTYNGTTTPITGSSVTIPVLTTSITMTFNPASQTERIEISDIYPDQTFRITNENLIRATVSLRSDLSLFDQTLPESEINIEVYHNADISESVANIPADTPIIYQAGYPGDMSPERKFYVSGQVTWADNVLTIHAVDAVHFLDLYKFNAPIVVAHAFGLLNSSEYMLRKAGIQYEGSVNAGTDSSRAIIPKDLPFRECMAKLNQLFNITNWRGQLLDGSGTLNRPIEFMYRDAGIPYVRATGQTDHWWIAEEDCADVKVAHDPHVSEVRTTWERIINPKDMRDEPWGVYSTARQKVGTATLLRDIGASLSFDTYAYDWAIGLFTGDGNDNEVVKKLLDRYGSLGIGYSVVSVVPVSNDGAYDDAYYELPDIYDPYVGNMLPYGEIPQEEFVSYPPRAETKLFSSFVPWTQRLDGWRSIGSSIDYTIASVVQKLENAGVIQSGAQSIDLDIYGLAYNTEEQSLSFSAGSAGGQAVEEASPFIGQIMVATSNGDIEIYPSKCHSCQMYRSSKTGSFTWKGDPRMQPRDTVDWQRVDGNLTTITLENITLTHEGGGTMAEITYREGVV